MADEEEVKVILSGDSSSLDAAIAASRKGVLALNNDLANGGEHAQEALLGATQGMADLADAMNRTDDVTDEQRAKIEALAEAYAGLAKETEEAAKKQEVSDEAVGSTTLSVGSLTKALVNADSPIVKYAGRALAVGEAFKFGWGEGEKLRATLNELTSGGFDRAVASLLKFDESAKDWVDWEDSAAVSTQRLGNELNILRKNGIDPTGLSVDQIRAKVDELGAAMQRHSTKDSEFTAAFQKEREALDDGLASFEKRVKAIEHGGEITTQQADLIVSEAKRQLDAIALLPADEQKAYEQRKATLEEYIATYKGATTEYIANTEKVAAAAGALAEKEIEARRRVTEELEKENAKKIESLQKKYDDALAAEQKANGGASGGSSSKLADEAAKPKQRIAELNAQPLDAQGLKELFDAEDKLAGLNVELGRTVTVQRDLATAGNAWGESMRHGNEESARATELITASRNAAIDLNQALLEQSRRQSEAEIATAVANTTYSEAAVILTDFKETNEEVFDVTGKLAAAVGKANEGQKLITNTYAESNVEIGRSIDGFTLLSEVQGQTTTDTAELADLMAKYGEKAKKANDTVEEGAKSFHKLADSMERCNDIGGKLATTLAKIGDS